jgi:hypothetical protein
MEFGGADLIYLSQDRDQLRAFVNTVMSIRVTEYERNFLTNWAYYLFLCLQTAVFCVIAPCSLVEVYRLSDVLAASIIRAMIEAASTSETSVNFYQTTRRSNPEDSRLHTRGRENRRSHIVCKILARVYKINMILQVRKLN